MGSGPLPFATVGEVFAPTFQVAQDLAASTVQELIRRAHGLSNGGLL